MKNWVLYALIAAFALAGTFVYLYHRNSVKSQEIERYEQNWKAAHDSVKYYEMKNGEIMAEKAGYILTIEQLEQELGISKSEIKDLQDKLKSKVSVITKVETKTVVDTLEFETERVIVQRDTITKEINNIIGTFSHNDEWLAMRGQFQWTPEKTSTTLQNLTMNTPLKVGMTENNTFFVSTPNPYVTITSVEGATLNPKKQKRFGIGLQVGVGMQYGLINKQIDFGPQIGIGLNYNLVEF